MKLADIAKELGVSTVTVSNALLGKKGVSDKMRELIWKKAQEMGYVKSAMMALQPESTGFMNFDDFLLFFFVGKGKTTIFLLLSLFHNIQFYVLNVLLYLLISLSAKWDMSNRQ